MIIKRFRLLALAAVCAACASPATAMSVKTFLSKADALKAQGPLAIMSPDLPLLEKEIGADGKAWRAQIHDAVPPVCPPAKVALKPDEIVALLRQTPEAQRDGTEVRSAFIQALNRRYACR